MQCIPSIDLYRGRVVRLQQGDFGRLMEYEVDPVALAEHYAAAGASRLHVVDLDGAAGKVTILALSAVYVVCLGSTAGGGRCA